MLLTASRKAASVAMSAAFVMQPFMSTALAADAIQTDIQRIDGTTITGKSNVYDIYAESVDTQKDLAINRFEKFNIGNNDIANMYFKTGQNGSEVNNLINFVNNKINIGGTVNALKSKLFGNEVGGNLYFVTAHGMTVTADGVINAGSLNVLVPTEDYLTKMGVFGSNPDVDSIMKQAQNAFVGQNGDAIVANVPLNSEGTISVEGKINVQTAARLMAGDIQVGNTGAIRNAMNMDKISNLSEKNQTKLAASDTMDIQKLDNGELYIQGVKNVAVDGIVTANKGNAVIKAVNEVTVEHDSNASDVSIGGYVPSSKAHVTVNGNVTGENVDISATAKTKFTYENANVESTEESSSGNTGETGDEDENSQDGILDYGLSASLEDAAGAFFAQANILKASADAKVTIGQGATIKSTAAKPAATTSTSSDDTAKELSGINISATSDVTTDLSLNIENEEDDDKNSQSQGQEENNLYFAGAVSYTKSKSTAEVEINGTVESEADLTVAADATNSSTISSTINNSNRESEENDNSSEEQSTTDKILDEAKGIVSDSQKQDEEDKEDEDPSSAYINAAVNVLSQYTRGKVNINEGASLTATDDVEIKANTHTTQDVTANVVFDNRAALSTSINIVSADTKADVNLNANVTGSTVDIGAVNAYDELSITTENAGGEDKSIVDTAKEKLTGGLKSFLGTDKENKGILGAIKNADDNTGSTSGDTEATKAAKGTTETDKVAKADTKTNADKSGETGWNQYVNLGAAVMVGNFGNAATVNVGKNVEVKATSGDAKLNAEVKMDAPEISTNSIMTTTDENTKVGVSAAVAVEKMHNDAAVVLNGDADSHASITAKDGNVKLTANVTEGAAPANSGNVIEDIASYLANDNSSMVTESKANKEQSKDKNTQNGQDANQNGNGDESVPFVATGAVGIQNVTNNANVYVGKNVELKASSTETDNQTSSTANTTQTNTTESTNSNEGSVVISSQVAGTAIMRSGKFGTSNEGGSVGMGGTVAVQNRYENSKVEIADGAKVTADKNISATTNNDLTNVVMSTGGSKTSTLGVTGMVSYMGGEANSRTIIGSGVKMNANAIGAASTNNTKLLNVAGQVSSSDTAAIGASVGVVSYDLYTETSLGKVGEDVASAVISADTVNFTATNNSRVNTLTVAGVTGGQSKKKDSQSGTSNKVRQNKSTNNTDAGNTSSTAEVLDLTGDSTGTHTGSKTTSADYSISQTNDSQQNVQAQTKEQTAGQKEENSKVSIAVAGSVSYNDVNGSAKVDLNNARITGKEQSTSKLETKAVDSSYIGAYSGAMARTVAQKTAGSSDGGASATLAGAVAVNDIVKDTSSTLTNVTLEKMSGGVSNLAANDGVQVATGVSIGLAQKNDKGANIAGSASLNFVDSDVKAEMDAVTVDGGSVSNIASDKDYQIAGGVNAQYTKTSAGIGASVVVNKTDNDIQATIKDSKLGTDQSDLTGVTNQALTSLKQIGTAVSAGLATGQDTYVGINGAVAANTLQNSAAAVVENTTIYAQKITVEANDAEMKNSYVNSLNSSWDIDISDIKEAIKGSDSSAERNGTEVRYTSSNTTVEDKGNLIVTGAMGINAGKANASMAAGVSYTDIDNDFTAGIKGGKIVASNTAAGTDAVKVNAATNTTMVGVSAGMAVAADKQKSGIAAAGSVAIQNLNNDTKAYIQEADITANKVSALANNTSRLVTVAGQVSGGTGNAVGGMAWAQNNLDNNTEAIVEGSNLTALTADDGIDITVKAQKNSNALAVGAGVAVAVSDKSGAAFDGSVAINTGKDNTKAAVDGTDDSKSKIENAKKVLVEANTDGTVKAIAGSLTASNKNLSMGGAVALNELTGGQLTYGALNNTDITTISASSLDVKAVDTDNIMTLGLGGAVGANTKGASVTAQGSVAISNLNKDTRAQVASTDINKESTDNANGALNVSASSTGDIVTSADALGISVGSNVAVSAAGAASVVKNAGTTKAAISGGTQKVDSAAVVANSNHDVLTVGAAAAIAVSSSSAVSAGANVAVNQMSNNAEALIENASITSDGNVIVGATNNNTLRNYGGALTTAVGSSAGVGVGATVVVNNLSGNTVAQVSDSIVNASNGADQKTNTYSITKGETAKDATGTLNSTESKKKGLIVTADSQQKLDNVSVTAGLAASTSAGISGAATVVNNTLGGSTKANIDKSTINNNAGYKDTDVSVLAHDDTDLRNISGNLSAGAGGSVGVAVGGAVNHNDFKRTTEASITGATNGSILQAGALDVRAASQANLTDMAHGYSIGAGADVGVAVSGAVTVNNFNNTTNALVQDENLTAGNVNITADNAKKNSTMLTVGALSGGIVAASAPVGVAVLTDKSQTKAELNNTSKASTASKVKSMNVAATGSNSINTGSYSNGLALGIGGSIATTIAVNNIQSDVAANVANANVQADGAANVLADNIIYSKAVNEVASGGAVAAGVGVSVNNIDSSTKVNVNNSTIKAATIATKADEKRYVDANYIGAAAGLAALGTNVSITNIGASMQDGYSYSYEDNSNNKTSTTTESYSTSTFKKQVESSVDGSNATISNEHIAEAGITAENDSVDWGGTSAAAGTGVNIGSGSQLSASGAMDIATTTRTDGKINLEQGSVSAVSANVSVGVTDIKVNNAVNIQGGSTVEGAKVNITAQDGGALSQDIYQGSVAGASMNAAVSLLKRQGSNSVNIADSKISAKTTGIAAGLLNINANENGSLSNNVYGATVGGYAAGALVAQTADTMDNNIAITGESQLTSAAYKENTVSFDEYTVIGQDTDGKPTGYNKTTKKYTDYVPTYNDINISADNASQVNTQVVAGAVGLASANAAVAISKTSGNSTVQVGDGSKALSIKAKNLNISNENQSAVTAGGKGLSAGIVSGTGVITKAEASGTTKVELKDKVAVQADALNAESLNKFTATADAVGAGAGVAALVLNKADANLNGTSELSVGKINLSRSTGWQATALKDDGTAVEIGQEVTDKGTALNLTVRDDSANNASSTGVNVGYISSGTNLSTTKNTSKTNLTMAVDKLELGSMNLQTANAVQSKVTADGTGGGVYGLNPLAAYAKNTSETQSNITLSGSYNIAGDVKVEAANNGSTKLLADAMQVSMAGLSGVEASNTINQNANMDFGKATLQSEGSVAMGTANSYSFGAANNNTYAVKGNAIGLASGAAALMSNSVTNQGNVNLGSVTSNGTQKLYANANNDITSSAYIYNIGALGLTYLQNNTTLTNDNKIIQNSGLLKTLDKGSNVTVAAVDNATINSSGVAENSIGLAAGTAAHNNNKVNRYNSVDIKGNIYSRNDANIYAGKASDDSYGSLYLSGNSEVYNRAVIPVSDSKLNNIINQKNQVNIGSDAKVEAVQDVNLYAHAGKETISQFIGTFTGWGGSATPSYVSTTNGKANVDGNDKELAARSTDNQVKVSGSVVAGIANVQKIIIGDDNWVVLTKDQYTAVEAYYTNKNEEVPANYVVVFSNADYKALYAEDKANTHYKSMSDLVKIQDGNGKENTNAGITTDDFTLGSYEYASSIKSRLEAISNLIADYERKDKTTDTKEFDTAYYGYKAEYEKLEADLKAKRMPNADVVYIELPELVASGGDIDVQTDKLYGGGTLTAQGTPSIEIDNKTSLTMNVNNVAVQKPGGNLYYNGISMGRDDNKDVNINVAEGHNGNIVIAGNIKHTTVGKTDSINLRVDNTDNTSELRSDVNIYGTVEAQSGDVTISSAEDDINISSTKDSKGNTKSGSVVGKNVTLKAETGSVSQSYTDGIVNIGGDVQQQYGGTLNKHAKNETVTLDGNVRYDNSVGTIAGNTVYINAADVNINGLVQSGYDRYYVDTKNISADKMASITSYNSGRKVSDAEVMGNSKYCLIEGGSVFNSSKNYYEYEIPVYYNPSNGHLLTADVENNGGKIYITGRISSTGNGRIVCMDGASDIEITNNLTTDNTLVLGKLLTNEVQGLIRLADTNTNKLYELTRADDGTVNTKVYNMADKNAYLGTTDTNLTNENGTYSYTPQSGLRYNWTCGVSVGTTKTYDKQWQKTFWGAGWTKNKSSALIDESVSMTPLNTVAGDENAKRPGTYIGANADAGTSNYSVVYGYYGNKDTPTVNILEERTWKSGFLGCHKNYYVKWSNTYGENFVNVYSVKADNPIQMSFIGNAAGNSKVDISSAKGDISLNGSIGNALSYTGTDGSIAEKGTVNITASNGNIIQNAGSIYGSDISLSAAGNMEGINITAGDNLNLTAKSINVGNMSRNIDITVDGNYGSQGNIVLAEAGTADSSSGDPVTDRFSLTANGKSGNITMSSNKVINSKRIDLTSKNGSITANVNAAQAPMGLDTLSASVNAQAAKDINLTQNKGDMRIGRIYSDGGDVTVNVAQGSVVDALPYGELQREEENALLTKWQNMGLLGDNNSALKEKDAPTAIGLNAAKARLEANNYSQIYDNKTDAANAKAADEQLVKTNSDTYAAWDANTLLYSIADSIMNPDSSSVATTSSKDPNVKGNNIVLNVHNSAGIDSDNEIVINASDLGGSGTGLENLKTLAKADASTVTMKSTKGTDGTDVTQFVIKERLPIGVQTNTSAGKLSIGEYSSNSFSKANGNVYVEGRTVVGDEYANKDLSIDKIASLGNVSIHSLGNILNGSTDGSTANIAGGSLDIQSAGSMGAAEKSLTMDLTGSLSAVGTGVYLDNIGNNNLVIKNVSSGSGIALAAKNNILMDDSATVSLNGKEVKGYIRAENNDAIDITSREGSVGSVDSTDSSKDKKLRIQNQNVAAQKAGTVTVKAAKDIVVEGLSNASDGTTPSGTLNITAASSNNTTLGNVKINVHGDLQTDNIIEANNVELQADNNILQTAGGISGSNVKVNAAGDMSLAGDISAANVNLNSTGDMTLRGNVSSTGTGTLALTAGKSMEIGGSVNAEKAAVNISAADGNMHVGGNVNAKAGSVELSAAKGSMTIDGSVSGTQVTANSKDNMTLGGNVTSTADNLTIGSTAGSVEVAGNVKGKGAVGITSKDAMSLKGTVAGEDTVTINSGGTLGVTGNISATNAMRITSSDTMTLGGKVDGKNNVTINSAAGMNITGDVTSAGVLDVDSTGAMIITGNVNSTGAADVESKDTLTINGNVEGTNAVTISAKKKLQQVGTNSHISGTDVAISSEADMDLAGSVSGSRVAVNSKDNMNLGGTVTSTVGTLTIGSTAGKVEIAGDVSGKGAVGITSGNAMSLKGKVSSEDAVTINSGSTLGVTGNISATNAMNVTSTGGMTLGGTVTGKDAVTINSGSTLGVTGAISADKAMSITSGGAMTLSSTVTGKNAVAINSGDTLGVTGAISADKAMSVISGNAMTLGGTVTGQDNVTINSGNTMEINGTVSSQGILDVDSTGAMTINGNINSTGAADIDSRDALTIDGKIDGKNNVTINSAKTMEINGAVSSLGELDVDSAGAMTITGDVDSIGAADIDSRDALTINGKVDGKNNVSINSAKTMEINGAVSSLGELDVDSAGAMAITGNVNSTGAADIESQDAMTINGSVQGENTVSLKSKNKLQQTGRSSQISGTNVTISSEEADMDLAGSVSGTKVAVNSKGNMNLGGTVTSTADTLTIKSTAGKVDVAGNVSGKGAMSITSGDAMSLKGTVSGENTVTINSGDILGVTGDISADKAMSVISGNAMTLGGKVDGKNNVTIDSAKTMEINGAVSSLGELDVDSSGAMTITGNVNSTGAADIDSRDALTINGKVDGKNNVTIDSAKTMEINGAVSSLGELDVDSTGAMSITGDVNSTGAADIESKDTLTVNGSVQGKDTVNIKSGNILGVTGDISADKAMEITSDAAMTLGGTVNGHDKVTIDSGNTLGVTGDISANKAMEITSNAAMTLGGTVIGKDAVTINSGNTLEANGDISGIGAIDIDSTSTMTLNGTVRGTDTADIDINSGDVLNLNGSVLGQGNVIMKSADDLYQLPTNSQVSGTNVKLDAEGNIQLKGDVTGSNKIDILTKKNIDLDGTLHGGDISISADGKANLHGTIQGKLLGMDVASLDLAGDITTTGAIDLNAKEDMTAKSNIHSDEGVNITAKKQFTQESGNITGPQVKISSDSDVALKQGTVQGDKVTIDTKADLAQSAEDHSIIADNLKAGSNNILELISKTNVIKNADIDSRSTDANNLIRLYNSQGDINIAVRNTASADNKISGSVEILNNAEAGNMTFTEAINANDTITAATRNGDIVLGEIAAGKIVLTANGAGSSLATTGPVKVGTNLDIKSDYITKPVNVYQQDGYKEPLHLSVYGNGAEGEESAVKGDMQMTVDSDAVFDTLHITDGTVRMDNNSLLDVEKVRVEGNATLRVQNVNTSIVSKTANLWGENQYLYQDTGKWMNLHVQDGKHQVSNGFLLHVIPSYSVGNMESVSAPSISFRSTTDYLGQHLLPITFFEKYNVFETYDFSVENIKAPNMSVVSSEGGNVEII